MQQTAIDFTGFLQYLPYTLKTPQSTLQTQWVSVCDRPRAAESQKDPNLSCLAKDKATKGLSWVLRYGLRE